jgi:hypothetical protein
MAAELAIEEELDEEPADRFRTWVALAIALISILGAIVAFRASLSEEEAHRLDLDGLQASAEVQQIKTNTEAIANEDQRTAVEYQDHIVLALKLEAEATKASDPQVAASLDAEAQNQRVLARTVSRFFQGAFPEVTDASTPVKIEREAEITRLLADNDRYGELHPEDTLKKAETVHTRAVDLLGLVTLFIAGLLFLTLAQFTRRSIRPLFAAAGGLAATVGVVLWVVIERSLAA